MVTPHRDCGSFDTRINIFLLKPEQVSSVVKTKNSQLYFCMIITNDCLSPRCVSSYTLPVEHKWKQQYLQMVFKWKKKKKKKSLTNKTTVALTWYYNVTPHWKTKMCVECILVYAAKHFLITIHLLTIHVYYTCSSQFQLVKLNAKVWLCPFSSVCVLWCAFVSLRTP